MAEHILKSRTFEKGGFTYTVQHIYDGGTEPDYLKDETRYEGCTEHERARYEAQDRERLAAFRRDEWHFMGVACDIRKQTSANWADGGALVGRASVWGIETDSTPAYLAETEKEIIAEAEAEIENLRRALCPARARRKG